MEMPRPAPEFDFLARLVGRWEGAEQIEPSAFDPEGGPATGRWHLHQLDGSFVYGDYEQERGGAVTFRGHAVYGWDAEDDHYTMYWFDSSAIDPSKPALGTRAGDTVSFLLDAKLASRMTHTIEDDHFMLLIESSLNGTEWSTFLRGDYRRV
ncbi:MAG: DUF1579 family protein [Acidimicrobiia bacterium]